MKLGKEFYWMLGQLTLIGLSLTGFQWAFNLYVLGYWIFHALAWIALFAVSEEEVKRRERNAPFKTYVYEGLVNRIFGVIFYFGNVVFLAALGYTFLTAIALITTIKRPLKLTAFLILVNFVGFTITENLRNAFSIVV